MHSHRLMIPGADGLLGLNKTGQRLTRNRLISMEEDLMRPTVQTLRRSYVYVGMTTLTTHNGNLVFVDRRNVEVCHRAKPDVFEGQAMRKSRMTAGRTIRKKALKGISLVQPVIS